MIFCAGNNSLKLIPHTLFVSSAQVLHKAAQSCITSSWVTKPIPQTWMEFFGSYWKTFDTVFSAKAKERVKAVF